MERKPLSFKPTEAEITFLETHDIGFSEFVHKAFDWAKNGDRNEFIDRLSIKLMITILGLAFFAFSYMLTNIYAWSIMILLSFFCTCFGTISIIFEVKNGRKLRHSFS